MRCTNGVVWLAGPPPRPRSPPTAADGGRVSFSSESRAVVSVPLATTAATGRCHCPLQRQGPRAGSGGVTGVAGGGAASQSQDPPGRTYCLVRRQRRPPADDSPLRRRPSADDSDSSEPAELLAPFSAQVAEYRDDATAAWPRRPSGPSGGPRLPLPRGPPLGP